MWTECSRVKGAHKVQIGEKSYYIIYIYTSELLTLWHGPVRMQINIFLLHAMAVYSDELHPYSCND